MPNRGISRRAVLGAAALIPLIRPALAAATSPDAAKADVAALESRLGGRLGVVVLDTGSGARLEHRADERFPLCSTFKFITAAAVLHRVDAGQESLDRRVTYEQRDVLDFAPVTMMHVKDGMSVAELCAAAIQLSDNTAANLLLATLGGPAGLTQYCRSLGDEVTRLDRTEPELNDVPPGDMRDTTTPAAMLKLLQTILRGDALSAKSRAQLENWLEGAKVGQKNLRAGLPNDWRIGHKSGSGRRGETNDVGIIWPPQREPLLVAAYYADSQLPAPERNAALASVGALIAKDL